LWQDIIGATGHVFSIEWIQDADNHWRECVKCENKTDVSAHSFGDWVTTKEPTETEEGEKARTCSACGHEETDKISMIGAVELWGDANGDGIVDSTDAMLVCQYDAWMIDESAIDIDACDVNGDGLVDSTDAMLICQYDAWMIDKFPVEELASN